MKVPTVGRSTFYQIWNDILPNIATMKPSSDLCFECQQNATLIIRSAHLSEDEKSERLTKAETHLKLAKGERMWYNWQIDESRCEENNMMHISFDYAQQVHFPSNPQQPGPLYFLTPRKCQIFGVACEAKGFQVKTVIS